jgi:hypothetical protein
LRSVLLIAVLGLHFFLRVSAHLATPLEEKRFYSSSYLVSLSLLSGHGFGYLVPRDAPDEPLLALAERLSGETGPAQPVMAFILRKGRDNVSGEEFQRYLVSGVRAASIDAMDGGWESTRVLDLYAAAALWSVWGIDWNALFALYALLSTAAALGVFLLARQLTRSPWGGLLGAAGFMASPLELNAGTLSIRDANPLWFTVLAFAALALLAGPFGSRSRSCLAWYLLGICSLLGFGWRTDALLLPPFVLAGLVSVLLARWSGIRQIVVACAAFAAGCGSILLLIYGLGHGSGPRGGVGFHIGWYGEHARSDLLLGENTFQVTQDDYLTLYQANYFRRQRLREPPGFGYYDPRHLSSVREMYLELVRYNAHFWWRRFPGHLASAARVDRNVWPNGTIRGDGPSAGRLPYNRLPEWSTRSYRWLLEPYLALVPFLAPLGALGGCLNRKTRSMTALLAAYFVWYAAFLMVILPEAKHWAPLLLPLHVLSALGVCAILTLSRLLVRSRDSGAWRQGALAVGVAVLALAAAWMSVGAAAHWVSREQRLRFIDSVQRLGRYERATPAALASNKLFSVRLDSEAANVPIGFLFKVRGAPTRPVNLWCLHARKGSYATPSYYQTRHTLVPGRDQYFFVNVVAGSQLADEREYWLSVMVRGSAEILSVSRIDLSEWSIGLPLSFVFVDGDRQPGNPGLYGTWPPTEILGSPEEVQQLVDSAG